MLNKIRSCLVLKEQKITLDYSYLENLQLLVIGINQQRKIEYVNSFVIKLTEYTKAEIIGKNWVESFWQLPAKKTAQPEDLIQSEKPIKPEFANYYKNSIFTKSGKEKIIAIIPYYTILKGRRSLLFV